MFARLLRSRGARRFSLSVWLTVVSAVGCSSPMQTRFASFEVPEGITRTTTALAAAQQRGPQTAQAVAPCPVPARADATATAKPPHRHMTLGDKFDLWAKHFERDHFGNDAWKQAFTGPELLKNLAWAAAFGASFSVDAEVKGHYDRHHFFGDAAKLGDWMLVGFPLTTAAMTLLAPPGRFEDRYDHLAAFTETIAAAGVTGLALKGVMHRDRPNHHGADSFPSEHTIITFATAKFISEAWGPEYGLKVKVPAYLLATFVAVARLERERHYVSDIIGGAAIGYLIADVIGKWHYGKDGINERSNVTVAPLVTPAGVGLVAEYKF